MLIVNKIQNFHPATHPEESQFYEVV